MSYLSKLSHLECKKPSELASSHPDEGAIKRHSSPRQRITKNSGSRRRHHGRNREDVGGRGRKVRGLADESQEGKKLVEQRRGRRWAGRATGGEKRREDVTLLEQMLCCAGTIVTSPTPSVAPSYTQEQPHTVSE